MLKCPILLHLKHFLSLAGQFILFLSWLKLHILQFSLLFLCSEVLDLVFAPLFLILWIVSSLLILFDCFNDFGALHESIVFSRVMSIIFSNSCLVSLHFNPINTLFYLVLLRRYIFTVVTVIAQPHQFRCKLIPCLLAALCRSVKHTSFIGNVDCSNSVLIKLFNYVFYFTFWVQFLDKFSWLHLIIGSRILLSAKFNFIKSTFFRVFF